MPATEIIIDKLNFSISSLSDVQATRLGLKQYFNGTFYEVRIA